MNYGICFPALASIASVEAASLSWFTPVASYSTDVFFASLLFVIIPLYAKPYSPA